MIKNTFYFTFYFNSDTLNCNYFEKKEFHPTVTPIFKFEESQAYVLGCILLHPFLWLFSINNSKFFKFDMITVMLPK